MVRRSVARFRRAKLTPKTIAETILCVDWLIAHRGRACHKYNMFQDSSQKATAAMMKNCAFDGGK